MTFFKKLYLFLIIFVSFFVVSCDNSEKNGDVLSSENDKTIVVENSKIKFVFNKENGSLREIYNKESDLFFIKDNNEATAIRIDIWDNYKSKITFPNEFNYLKGKIEDGVSYTFHWTFNGGQKVTVDFKLTGQSEDGIFNLSMDNNNVDKPILAVEYPVITNIKSLGSKNDDYFVIADSLSIFDKSWRYF